MSGKLDSFIRSIIFPRPRDSSYDASTHPGELLYIPLLASNSTEETTDVTYGYFFPAHGDSDSRKRFHIADASSAGTPPPQLRTPTGAAPSLGVGGGSGATVWSNGAAAVSPLRTPAAAGCGGGGGGGSAVLGAEPTELAETLEPAAQVLLYAHPNAVDVGMLYNEMSYLSQMAGVHVLAFEYTGYGPTDTASTADGDGSASATGGGGGGVGKSNSSSSTTITTTPAAGASHTGGTAASNSSCSSSAVGNAAGSGGGAAQPSLISEQTIQRDARSAYYFVLRHLRVPPERIVLCGRSIGAAPMAWLAASLPPALVPSLVVLQCPFTALSACVDSVSSLANFLGYNWFRTIDVIARVSCPVVLHHGACDDVVPAHHSWQLKAARDAARPPLATTLCIEEEKEHNNLGRACLVRLLRTHFKRERTPLFRSPGECQRLLDAFVAHPPLYDALLGWTAGGGPGSRSSGSRGSSAGNSFASSASLSLGWQPAAPAVPWVAVARHWRGTAGVLRHYLHSPGELYKLLTMSVCGFTVHCARAWQLYQALHRLSDGGGGGTAGGELDGTLRVYKAEFIRQCAASWGSPVGIHVSTVADANGSARGRRSGRQAQLPPPQQQQQQQQREADGAKLVCFAFGSRIEEEDIGRNWKSSVDLIHTYTAPALCATSPGSSYSASTTDAEGITSEGEGTAAAAARPPAPAYSVSVFNTNAKATLFELPLTSSLVRAIQRVISAAPRLVNDADEDVPQPRGARGGHSSSRGSFASDSDAELESDGLGCGGDGTSGSDTDAEDGASPVSFFLQRDHVQEVQRECEKLIALHMGDGGWDRLRGIVSGLADGLAVLVPPKTPLRTPTPAAGKQLRQGQRHHRHHHRSGSGHRSKHADPSPAEEKRGEGSTTETPETERMRLHRVRTEALSRFLSRRTVLQLMRPRPRPPPGGSGGGGLFPHPGISRERARAQLEELQQWARVFGGAAQPCAGDSVGVGASGAASEFAMEVDWDFYLLCAREVTSCVNFSFALLHSRLLTILSAPHLPADGGGGGGGGGAPAPKQAIIMRHAGSSSVAATAAVGATTSTTSTSTSTSSSDSSSCSTNSSRSSSAGGGGGGVRLANNNSVVVRMNTPLAAGGLRLHRASRDPLLVPSHRQYHRGKHAALNSAMAMSNSSSTSSKNNSRNIRSRGAFSFLSYYNFFPTVNNNNNVGTNTVVNTTSSHNTIDHNTTIRGRTMNGKPSALRAAAYWAADWRSTLEAAQLCAFIHGQYLLYARSRADGAA